jgi:prefoldin subunit 5
MEETVKFMQLQINALQEELKKKDAIIQEQQKELTHVLKIANKYAEGMEVTL